MDLLYKSETVIKAVSKNRPKSLIFRISGALYEIMQIKDGTPVIVEVCKDENKKYLKIYEKTD